MILHYNDQQGEAVYSELVLGSDVLMMYAYLLPEYPNKNWGNGLWTYANGLRICSFENYNLDLFMF
jgi:hypothetical protein